MSDTQKVLQLFILGLNDEASQLADEISTSEHEIMELLEIIRAWSDAMKDALDEKATHDKIAEAPNPQTPAEQGDMMHLQMELDNAYNEIDELNKIIKNKNEKEDFLLKDNYKLKAELETIKHENYLFRDTLQKLHDKLNEM